MPIAVRTPRLNNNDDFVRFTHIHCAPGSFVRKGDVIAEIETDKASVTIEVEQEGFVLAFAQPLGEMIPVGSVLVWIGATMDERVPDAVTPALAGAGNATAGEPTLKASILLARYGLAASDVPRAGDRLTASEVLDYVQARGISAPAPIQSNAASLQPLELIEGERVALTSAERGMLKTVQWHRDVAVPGYVEIEYDGQAWDTYAAAFQQRHHLLLNPLLALMAYRLVQLAKANRKLNGTVVDNERHEYRAVNLGFTVQSGAKLTLLCVREADSLAEKPFADALMDLMRRAMKDRLTGEETFGATLSFSSMARWQVTRHMPILPPYTSMMVAHTHSRNGVAALGATYDHRVLTGGEVAVALRALAVPESGEAAT